MFSTLFFYSFINGHVCCFQLLSSVDNTAMKGVYKYHFETLLSVLLGPYPKVELLLYLLFFEECCPLQVVLVVKNLPASVGDVRDVSSIPGSGRSPGEGNGHPLQYSCLENPMDRGAWQPIVYSVAELVTTEATWHACIHPYPIPTVWFWWKLPIQSTPCLFLSQLTGRQVNI